MKLKISPVQQRMCDGNPDVDAIFRLTNNNIDYKFKKKNYFLGLKSLCPFNSQNTVWHKLAFPMMYLPSYCSMRATDIWRGFVALRLLNNYKWNLSFLEPTVIQIRNAHNLMHDFSQELEVYKNTIKFNKILKKTNLSKHHKDLLKNLFKCYEAIEKLPEQLKKQVVTVLLRRNEAVVSYNDIYTACLSCNTCIEFLGALEQAKSALFYLIDYINKNKVKLGHCLSIIREANEKKPF
jgi:hypothetical protein